MSDESVRVAVRVRPFNQREKNRNAKLTIEMKGKTTIITNPENPSDKKSFTFDFSYWSHDGFKENKSGILIPANESSNYASQQVVFEDLGRDVLKNAFDGYNCSLFAYGQTGSGKSYSMVGYGANKGIVPVVCDELFKEIKQRAASNLKFEVSFSMLEIYNENVRDLLTKDSSEKGGLPVRQSPIQGFYVQGLKKVPVGSYSEIESRMEQGTSNRTVAMTNMNATSSRAHTVVTITFEQISKSGNSNTKKSSIMNLVDLAGSERADSTGATGDRLKEGANINKSLSVLGNVISALADLSNGKKKVMVPYRDSVLTKLLQNALGGNSKTVMIAALSPADINFDETLGTLRYADRAKQIKNKAVVNENPVDKLLRELREENERLKKALTSDNLPQNVAVTEGLSKADANKMREEIMEELKAQLSANTEIIAAEDPSNWDAKLAEARKETEIIFKEEKSECKKRQIMAHLINLNEDPQLSGVILHYLEGTKTLITRKDEKENDDDSDDDDEDDDDDDDDSDGDRIKKAKLSKIRKRKTSNNMNSIQNRITLQGLSISNKHAIIEQKSDKLFTIRPGLFGAKTKVNGNMLSNEIELHHQDRILFGSNHMYLFVNPTNPKSNKNLPKIIDWEFAQGEIAHADGFETENVQGLTKDQQITQQQILEIIPMVNEVNAIAEELGKFKKFSVILVPPNSQDAIYGAIRRTVLMIKVTDTKNGNFWLWERGKFMNRRYLMQEQYHKFLESNTKKQKRLSKVYVSAPVNTDDDPFWEPPEEVLVGTANAFLQAMAYNLDFDDRVPIVNYEGEEEGFIYLGIFPSTANGRVLDSDNNFVEDPKCLLTRTCHFLIQIEKVELNNPRYNLGMRVRYRVFKDEKQIETPIFNGSNHLDFNHNRVISFARITNEHLEYFENGFITFRIYANQNNSLPVQLNQTLSVGSFSESKRRLSVIPQMDPSEESSKYKSEIVILTKKLQRLEKKDRYLKTLCSEWTSNSRNNNYESFFKAVKALVYGSETNKFRSTGMIVGHSPIYS